jgi:hypothetical protein
LDELTWEAARRCSTEALALLSEVNKARITQSSTFS